MFFKSRVHDAVMSHVKTKIKQADEAYKKALEKHREEYKKDILSAKQLWIQKRAIALEESVQSVLKGLL